ncbi:endonuclease III domain-containing protein [candidate division KSB1 bacterium]
MNKSNNASANLTENLPGLPELYSILFDQYGAQNWWPADTPFEVIIGAILTQNTNWKNVERALSNLREAYLLNPEGLFEATTEKIAGLIRPSGYFNQKARKIKAFMEYFHNKYNSSINRMSQTTLEALRGELLELYGIGKETADSILLYAVDKSAFVIDTYTKRILSRIGYIEESLSYASLKQWIENRIPRDIIIYKEFHALFVRHGKICCRPRPDCRECPVNRMCRFYLSGGF